MPLSMYNFIIINIIFMNTLLCFTLHFEANIKCSLEHSF